MHTSVKKSLRITNNYNINHHSDYLLTMSLRINMHRKCKLCMVCCEAYDKSY